MSFWRSTARKRRSSRPPLTSYGASQLVPRRTFLHSNGAYSTPLTLITGPLEDILDGKDLGRGVREKLEMVTRNANRFVALPKPRNTVN